MALNSIDSYEAIHTQLFNFSVIGDIVIGGFVVTGT